MISHRQEPPLPEGVSRWTFVAPGAILGFTAGALLGWLPGYVATAFTLEVFAGIDPDSGWVKSVPGPTLWLAWWVWFALAFAAAGEWTGYRIWAAGENPLPHRFASPANESGAIRTNGEP